MDKDEYQKMIIEMVNQTTDIEILIAIYTVIKNLTE